MNTLPNAVKTIMWKVGGTFVQKWRKGGLVNKVSIWQSHCCLDGFLSCTRYLVVLVVLCEVAGTIAAYAFKLGSSEESVWIVLTLFCAIGSFVFDYHLYGFRCPTCYTINWALCIYEGQATKKSSFVLTQKPGQKQERKTLKHRTDLINKSIKLQGYSLFYFILVKNTNESNIERISPEELSGSFMLSPTVNKRKTVF